MPWCKIAYAPWMKYPGALLAVGIALLLKLMLRPALDLPDTPFVTLFAAIMISAWYGGTAAGIFATLMAMIAADFFLLTPGSFFPFQSPQDALKLALFLLEGIVFSVACGARNRLIAELREHERQQQEAIRLAKRTAEEREHLHQFIDAQRQLFLAVANNASVGILILDGRNLTVKWFNPAFGQFLLDSLADRMIVGSSFEEILPAPARDAILDIHRAVAASGKPFHHPEFELIGLPRGVTYWRWSVLPLLNQGDDPSDLMSLTVEVTEQVMARKAVETLAAQDATHLSQLQAIMTSMTDGLVIGGLDGQILSMNPAALKLLGYSCPEERGKSLGDLADDIELRYLDGRLLPLADRPLSRALRGETFAGFEAQVRNVKTAHYWIGSFNGSPVRDQEGEIILAITTVNDVTARIGAEEERRHLLEQFQTEQAKLNTVFENAPEGIIVTDEAGRIVLANPVACHILDRPIPYGEDYESHSVFELYHPIGTLWPARDLPLVRSALDGEVHGNVELILHLPRDRRRIILANTAPILDRQGQINGAIAVFQDITSIREIEHERQHLLRLVQDYFKDLQVANADLESQRAQLEAILQHLPAGVLIAEAPLGRMILGNAQVEKIFRQPFIPALSIEHYGDYPFFHPDGRPYDPAEYPLARSIQAGDTVTDEEIDFLRGDGMLGTLRFNSIPIRNREGRIAAAVGTFHDVTEDNRLREELRRRADELSRVNSSKDEFLAMLAHELRNPLSPILSALHILHARGADGDPSQKRSLEMIERQTQHMARLVEDLLDVSRISSGKIELRKEPLDLATIVRQSVESSNPLIENRQHTLTVSLPQEPVCIDADPARIEQIISNLLNNAAKYTPCGGHLHLHAGLKEAWIEIRVSDNGMGLAPDMLTHIFELFSQVEHSLDRSQGGLGIGLTLVRRLAELHGGSAEAFSRGLGKGSEFVVRLPVLSVPSTSAEYRKDGPSPTPPGRQLRVLIVEDNTDTPPWPWGRCSKFGAMRFVWPMTVSVRWMWPEPIGPK